MTRAKTTARLIATVVVTAIGLNIVTADQYIALVLPRRMFRDEFRKRGLQTAELVADLRGCGDGDFATGTPELPRRVRGGYAGVATLCICRFVFSILRLR